MAAILGLPAVAAGSPVPDHLKLLPNALIGPVQTAIIAATGLVDDVISIMMEFLIQTYAFGKGMWAHYIKGDIGEVPELPANIKQVLEQQSPFFPGKTVKESSLLYYIPEFVGEKRLTLNLLNELVKDALQGEKIGLRGYIWDQILKEHGDTPIGEGHWALMTNDVVPGSRNRSFIDQEKMVNDAGYEVPDLLDAAVIILLEQLRSGTRLFSDNPGTYTYCKEITREFHLVIGGFTPDGLDVRNHHDYEREDIGVAALRKF